MKNIRAHGFKLIISRHGNLLNAERKLGHKNANRSKCIKKSRIVFNYSEKPGGQF